MPLPSLSSVHVDRPLTNFSEAILQGPEGFVSRKMFPTVPVSFKSDQYYIFNRDDFNRTDATIRAPGAPSPISGYRLSTDSYKAQVWALKVPLDDQQVANADPGLDLSMAATKKVTMDLMIREEVDWAATFFTTSVWNADTTPAVPWENVNSTPIEDIRAREYVMLSNTGLMPNKIAFGADTYKRLVDHPDILDRIKYTQRGVVTADLIAAILELQSAFVLRAVRNTAAEGAASGTYGFIGGNNDALLVHSPDGTGLMDPAAGKTFNWSGYLGANQIRIARYRTEPERSEWIDGETAFDHKVTAAVLGEFFSNAVTN